MEGERQLFHLFYKGTNPVTVYPMSYRDGHSQSYRIYTVLSSHARLALGQVLNSVSPQTGPLSISSVSSYPRALCT